MKLFREKLSRIFKSLDLADGTRVVVINNFGVPDISDEEYNTNLFCVDNSDSIVWQVVIPPSRHGPDAFLYVNLVEGLILAKKESGTKFVVDRHTGVATEVGFEK